MKHHGFTLVELMLAVSLSSILLLGMMEAYLSLHQTYLLQQKLARLQENGRFTIFYLNQNIRKAGDAKCINQAKPVDQERAIVGYPTTQLSAQWQRYLAQHMRANTDAIIIGACQDIAGKTQFTETAYFIGKATPSLYEKHTNSERSQELVDGVTDMQIKYGVRNANKTLTYLSANAVSNWQAVISVEVALTIQDKKWYTYIKLRNRN